VPRRSHIRVEDGEAAEQIDQYRVELGMSGEDHDYLMYLANIQNERRRAQGIARRITIQDVVRSMIGAHRNRSRLLGGQLEPEDT
jgi:hypothetical protein